ncbi:helix-turn-helix domain-containing protein [Rhodococcus sp. AG1013]|uniref:helix-turn-helix domain-containing protein n=1 Tax=Rhodococcus sp. AG1013 TaxID=2183996 RepID=UPI000E0C5CAE
MSEHLSVASSTAHRLLATMQHRGFPGGYVDGREFDLVGQGAAVVARQPADLKHPAIQRFSISPALLAGRRRSGRSDCASNPRLSRRTCVMAVSHADRLCR